MVAMYSAIDSIAILLFLFDYTNAHDSHDRQHGVSDCYGKIIRWRGIQADNSINGHIVGVRGYIGGHSMKRMRIVCVVSTIVLVCFGLVGCGEPAQKDAKSTSKPKTKQANQELILDKVGYVPVTSDGSYYRVVGRATNNNHNFSVVGASATVTLYNAQNVVLGTERFDLVPIYPNSYDWMASNTLATAGQSPARADIKVNTDGCWKKTSKKSSGFSIVQKNYVGSEYDSKITGVFRYSGETLSKNDVVMTIAVALNANGDPIGAGRDETGNITTSGDYPFESSLGIPIQGVADTDVSVFTTGMRYLK